MEPTSDRLWPTARERLREVLSPEIFNLWFASIRAARVNGEEIVLGVPNEFCQIWLQENYLDVLSKALAQVSGRPWAVKFHLDPAPSAGPSGGGNPPPPPPVETPEPAEPLSPSARELLLNPRYTFGTFVVGNNNSFAHAAATAVAKSPGKWHNPLFIYGGSGLGKTHLLQAIGQHVVAGRKQARVVYLSSERFTNEFIEGLQSNQLGRFRRRYRQTDVLLIDDVQFLAGKERIQEEFFHTFNALHEAHRQIVLTCDRPPGEIQNLEQRLVTRFEWGLVADLQPPDVETRVAILRTKEKAYNLNLPQEIIEFLASRVRSNIRRLEGALIKVAAYASLAGKELTLEVVEQQLRDLLHEEGRYTITIETIQKQVAQAYDIRLADMTSKRRPESIAFPRQIAMYLARQLTDASLNTIGEAFGGRDHGTVLHAWRHVKDRMSVEPALRQRVEHLEKQLRR